MNEGSQNPKADSIWNVLVDTGIDMLGREHAVELHRTLFQEGTQEYIEIQDIYTIVV